METVSINFLAVFVAGVAYMILGALWYSPLLFGNAWMKGIGKTKEQVAKDFSPVNYILAIILSFIAAYGIARLMLWSGGNTVVDAIKISIVCGVCFVLATIGVNDVFEKRVKCLTVINILYHLVGFIVIGIILAVWP
jgi:Protein of unknown function (DUF1761)